MSAAPGLVPSVDVVPLRSGLSAARSGRSSGRVAPSRESPVRGTGTVERRAMTVLVVEPDPRLRRLLEVALEKAGFQVSLAAGAEEGLAMVGPLRPLPSLVIAEASLAGARGRTFCEQLREEPRTQSLPILALASDEPVQAGTGTDVLRKPVFVRDVVALAVLKAGKHCLERIFECDTELLPLADLVRALLAGNACGRLALATGDQLDFREGKVVRATYEGAEGELALRRILLFGRGAFSVRLGPITPAGEFTLGLREFCRSALPRVRRFERVLPRGLPLEARLSLDLPQLVKQLDQLPAEVERLARLFDGFRTVRDALIDVDMDEPMALEALTRLYELGVLTPAPAPQTPTVRAGSLVPLRAAPPAAVLEGLPGDALRQLEAFRIRTVSDQPVRRVESALSAPLLEVLPGAASSADRPVPPVKRARLPLAAEPALAEDSGASPAEPAPSAEPSVPAAPARGARRLWVAGSVVLTAAALLAATAVLRGHAPLALRASSSAQLAPVEVNRTPEAKALFRAGQKDAARALLSRILAQRPASADAWALLADDRFDSGDLAGAEQAALTALSLDPEQAEAKWLLGNVYLSQHRSDQAAEAFRAYLTLEPSGAQAERARHLLGTLSAR